MLQWIYENRAWLFDGAVVAVLLAILGWLSRRRKHKNGDEVEAALRRLSLPPLAETPRPGQPCEGETGTATFATIREVYLVKARSASGADMLVETDSRCHHPPGAWVRIGQQDAPKNHKDVRYLARFSSSTIVMKTEVCTHPGCGLFRRRYEMPAQTK
ncbi:hypothetical protein B1L11_33950 [Microbispora sp. GKU 823]|nr:hypothetical protein B1L11_33950 [Microbispora sp. GKU 823]